MKNDRGDNFPHDILNQMEFRLIKDWKEENCQQDHNSLNLKETGILFVWVQSLESQ